MKLLRLLLTAFATFVTGIWLLVSATEPVRLLGLDQERVVVSPSGEYMIRAWQEGDDVHVKITPEGMEWIKAGMPECLPYGPKKCEAL